MRSSLPSPPSSNTRPAHGDVHSPPLPGARTRTSNPHVICRNLNLRTAGSTISKLDRLPAVLRPDIARLRRQLVRYRWLGFTILGLIYLLAYNGQWQMTADSALYRELGRNLSDGLGYVYHGQPHDHAYPGLPLLLAAARRLLGQDLPAALLLNLALTAGALGLLYATLKQSIAHWIAVLVTWAAGVNALLVEHSTLVLTDVPFFFSVCLLLYGQSRLRTARGASTLIWAGLAATGLAMAAMLRPAFYILLAAMLIWMAVELLRGSRKRAVLTATAVAGFAVAWWCVDLRNGGHDESKLLRLLHHPDRILERLSVNAPALLTEHGPEAIFGLQLSPGIDPLLTVAMFLGGLMLWRRNAFWASLVATTLAATLLFAGTVPRYFLPIMPLLLLGWVDTVRWLAVRLKLGPLPKELAWLVAITLIFGGNIAISVKHILRQHDPRPVDLAEQSLYQEMAESIQRQTLPTQRTIGPEARILTFLSRRDVIPAEDYASIDPERWAARLNADHVAFVLMPASLYSKLPAEASRLIDHFQSEAEGSAASSPSPWSLYPIDDRALHALPRLGSPLPAKRQ